MSCLDGRDLNGYYVATMREIGVRELKARLSEVLRSVQAGESVRITNHGKPVADLVPPRRLSFEERLDELTDAGLLRRAPHPVPKSAPPLAKVDGSASDLIIAERDEER